MEKIIGLNTKQILNGSLANSLQVTLESLQESFPQALVEYENKQYIDYNSITTLLVATVQEQQNQLANLTDVISDLEDIIGIGLFGNISEESRSVLLGQIDGLKETNDKTLARLSDANSKATLKQNSPNPFSKTTTISYSLPSNTQSAKIMFFDLQGTLQNTVNLENKEGESSIKLNANTFIPGMYLYTLMVNNKIISTKRMIITKE